LLFVLIWIVTLILSVSLFRKASGSLSPLKPNMHSLIFYYSLLFSCYIGSLLIVLDIDDHYMLVRLEHEEYRLIGFLYICFIMIFMPLSMFILSKWVGFEAEREFNAYLAAPVSIADSDSRDFFYIISGLSALSILSIAYTFLKLDHIPILELLRGSTNLGQLRIEASHGFKGNQYIRNIFALGLTPILSFISYAYASSTPLKRWRVLFLVLFSLSVLTSVYDLQKAPLLFYLLMFILLNIYLGKLKLNIKSVISVGLLGFCMIILMYVYIQGVTAPSQFLAYNSGPIGRIILTQISPFYLHLDLFGEEVNFLNGQSLPNLLTGLYDFEQVRSARLAMEHYYPEKVEQGIAGVINTIFAGEAYANFGAAGILIGTIYIGLFVQIMYIAFIRLPKHPITISLFIYFTVTIPRVMVGGFIDFVFNPFWIFILGLFLGLLFLRKLKVDFLEDFLKYFRNNNEPYKNR
jgi:oligosaccharide repeat unit polymerase